MDAQERWYADNIPLSEQVVADVGANVGRLSQFFWDAGDGTNTVVSIEPVRQNVRAIEKRIATAGQAAVGRWRVEHCAVSDRDGELRMHVFVSEETGLNSVIATSQTQGDIEVVPCRRLSSLIPDATVVKVDVEGHEYPILEEAVPRLEHVHTWTVELHMVPDRPLSATAKLLEDAGFRVYVAGHQGGDPKGGWQSFDMPRGLSWNQIPVAKVRADGSVFKMLHVLARRE